MRTFNRLLTLAVLAICAASCGATNNDSRAPLLLTVASITAANNNNVLLSDVATSTGGVVNDLATAVLATSMKNTTIAPTTNNQVTIHRYHVKYERADGRNQPGVDVPYEFDGAVTVTIPPGGTASVSFEIVRLTAKVESPLAQLVANRNQIATLATVTFYGADAVGNTISASGTISVNFSNLAGS